MNKVVVKRSFQSVFWTCLVLTSNMSLQVLPLRVLVSRQVIKDRMDYTGYLAGKTRSEMDILDRLAGRFVVQASELTVERVFGGEKLPADEWERRRRELPATWINFLDGTEEISIVEKSSSGARKWVISDVDGVKKRFLLTSRGRILRDKYWSYSDYYVEDGHLITAQKTFMMERSKLALDQWTIGPLDQSLVALDYFDSFSTDKQGNLVREFICSMPIINIKITIVMSALRISESEKPLQRGSSAVRKVFEKIRKEGKHLFQNMLSELRGN